MAGISQHSSYLTFLTTEMRVRLSEWVRFGVMSLGATVFQESSAGLGELVFCELYDFAWLFARSCTCTITSSVWSAFVFLWHVQRSVYTGSCWRFPVNAPIHMTYDPITFEGEHGL
ncbi:hypothetical protein K458DRAFT_138258 [Lentithecium fluviatile CBS 122367]|uniref:Uncharacterized protein n=1 Tax=Lentithecium fluviatile CBS 122367 TaxID=1168545 RepID=A0A6G1IJY0_9PLEO|nr:hypothetical protein K458DRAFT_138258 [Lentithecium fluviatile CBS 122367]